MALSYPECVCLRGHMAEALLGKQIESIWVFDVTQVEGSWRFSAINQPPGGFVPRACEATLGKPCSECGTPMAKLKFEGGTSYLCPTCQQAP